MEQPSSRQKSHLEKHKYSTYCQNGIKDLQGFDFEGFEFSIAEHIDPRNRSLRKVDDQKQYIIAVDPGAATVVLKG